LTMKSGLLRKKGVGNEDIGFLPWKIAELGEQLQSQFRQWRTSVPGSTERAALERSIINTAGNLGHYVGDAANPHHATIHHNGWLGVNREGFAFDCGTHSRFESRFVTRAATTNDVVPKLATPKLQKDYFASAIAMIHDSNGFVRDLYTLDRDKAFDPIRPVSASGKDFATTQLARGASMLRDIWWSAWKNSERPPRRRSTDD
jgi:hypothetical protein